MVGAPCTVTLQLDGKHGSKASVCQVDEHHTNPKASWMQMGSPVYPTPSQLAALETASAVVWTPLLIAADEVTLNVPANGLAVVDVPLAA